MDFILESFRTSLSLILSFDSEVFQTVRTSLHVSFWSSIFGSAIGIPVGLVVAGNEFPLKRSVTTILNTLMALPTVVVGLVVYGFISQQGPLGQLGLLFTPRAMIIGQSILAIPIIANYTLTSVNGADPRIVPTALTLGATHSQATILLLKEIRFGIMAAVIAGFGRVISEVGVAMMLGGNIRSFTRTMTTAIAMETSKGDFSFGLAIGIILMTIALLVNILLNQLQQR